VIPGVAAPTGADGTLPSRVDVSAAKAAIRRELRNRLAAVDRSKTGPLSAALCEGLIAKLEKAGTVLAFAPIAGEPDLTPFLDWAWVTGVRLCFPRMNWQTRTMEAALIPGGGQGHLDLATRLKPTRHGILQPPPSAPAVPNAELGAVLVPGLGFDPQGRRIGRGAGFYDRFLADPGLRAAKVGIAFDLQVVDSIPVEPHDASVDAIATERRWIVVQRPPAAPAVPPVPP
jgi:5-formyltetrahydrofolate cyclo-ligase